MNAQVLQPDVNDQLKVLGNQRSSICFRTWRKKKCERHFIETSTRQEDGRYVVSLPFKPDRKSLGHSLPKAVNRFSSLERKFQQDGNLKQRYTAFIQDLLQHMEAIPEEEVPVEPSKSFYLPHHAVTKEFSTTTKLRVVFDGSALTTNGNSLKGNLMVSAKQQDDIFGILLRFQLRTVALSPDIEKMYGHIALSKEAKDFHRIVWRPDLKEELQHLRMSRATYGIRSSSYHSIRSLRSVADGDSLVDEVILSDSHLDDFLTGAESINEGKKSRNELQEELLSGGFPLRKWSSSSVEVLKDLPPHLLETKDVLELNKEDKSIKALGVVWYPSRGVFCFRYYESFGTGNTKRKLLSEIAKIFDPLGWIAPITITLKMLMQATWVKGLQWDDTLPVYLEETWQAAHE